MDSTDKKVIEYKVNFVNNSFNTGSIMLFQKPQDLGGYKAVSLAWFAKKVRPTAFGYFDWTLDYSFVWAETGVLKPGVIFMPSQMAYADLITSNSIGLTYDHTCNFVNQEQRTPSGSLYIRQEGNIPLRHASVGIGMSGSGVFAVQAQPNINLVFTPHPEYWIAFGNYFKGEALNIEEMTNCVRINFPPGVYTMNAVLNPDNSWTIGPAG